MKISVTSEKPAAIKSACVILGIFDRRNTLGDDEYRALAGFFFQCSAESRIGLEIKGGKAVIENVNRRFFD